MEIQRELGIATNVLADRLESLVDNEILRRVPYEDRPRRYEYVLTDKGSGLGPAIIALREWGRHHLEWDEPLPDLRHTDRGGSLAVGVVCTDCGEIVDLVTGVAGSDRLSRAPTT